MEVPNRMGVPKPSCSMWRSLEWKLQPQPKTVQLRFLLVALGRTSWAVLGLCWAQVGSFDGLYGLPWRFLEGTKISQTKAFRLGSWRAMSGQCWAVLGLCWAQVGSFDGLYGLPWKFLEGNNQPQRESLSVEVHVGSFGGLSVASRNCYMEACSGTMEIFMHPSK